VHDAVLHAVRDDRAAPGPVTVDLAPVTAEVKQRLVADRVPFARRIPVEHTRVAVVPARDVPGLRKGYQVLETAALWLPLAAVTLAVAGIAVAGCRRRALTATGLGTALGGALLGLAVLLGRRLTLADLPERIHRPAAGAVYDALTAGLRTASWLLLALGLGVALLAWLTGHRPPRPPRRPAHACERPAAADRPRRPARPRAHACEPPPADDRPRRPARHPHPGPPTASSLLPTLGPGVALLSLLTRHCLPGPRRR